MGKKGTVFRRKNYIILAIGIVILAFGFALMGIQFKSQSADDLYSLTKITLSPLVLMMGYAVLTLSIFKK